LINIADKNFAKLTKNKCIDVISKTLDPSQPQNMSQITFTNGSYIKSLSPTDSSRGETADILFIDEFAFIPEELFYTVFEPMVSKSSGRIILTSTPNGAAGLGYNIFDPYNEKQSNEYYRIWVPWYYCEDEVQKAEIKQKRESWLAQGKIKEFEQEYEAKFTVSETAFFDATKIDASINHSLSHVYEWKTEPCSMGIDYGWKRSHTVISIVSLTNSGDIVERYMHSYPTDGSDVDIFNDILSLCERFNIKHIVPDDCPAGYLVNQKLINKGLPVQLFNFRTDQSAGERNRGYYMLRSGIYKKDDERGKVWLTNNKELVKELKMLLEVHKQINVSIRAPPSENDDRSDAFCLACYPFLLEYNTDNEPLLTADDYGDDENKNLNNPRFDKQWAIYTADL